MSRKNSKQRAQRTPADASATNGTAEQLDLGPALAPEDGEPLFRTDRVLESLRFAEYDINAGIGEFIDNSVEAKAQHITVFVKPKKGKKKSVVGEVAIVDDGVGMKESLLRRALILGESDRPLAPDGKMGIGRFGVGMTMGGISLAKRIEVYSRADASAPFRYVYLDLNEIAEGKQKLIAPPIEKEPLADYADLLKDSSGTIVVLTDCDRLQHAVGDSDAEVRASEVIKDLPAYIGRTFRKFIHGGTQISFNDGDKTRKVYLHDPLYMLGPTYWDESNPDGPDPKATQIGEIVRITLPVPDKPGETADVTAKISLLPKAFREEKGAGGTEFAKRRKIPDNEGISVLRANREVLYGKIEYLIGQRGQSAYLRPDRFWGCEISFPPELDPYFHVRFIKRGAEPVPSVRDKIRNEISAAIKQIRQRIQDDWKETKEQLEKAEGVYREAEDAMANAERKLPGGKRGSQKNEEEAETTLEQIVEEEQVAVVDDAEGKSKEERKEERKKELASRPYSIVPVEYPASVFFEPIYLPGRIIIKLNVKHPFYTEVFEPLCGSVSTLDQDSDVMQGAETEQQRLARRGFLLMLMSYAKAESFFGEEPLFVNLRGYWAMTLQSALID